MEEDVYLVDDASMGNKNNRNGGPIVVHADDQQEPNSEYPKRAFYVNAPQFHWHQYVIGAIDEGARAGIQ